MFLLLSFSSSVVALRFFVADERPSRESKKRARGRDGSRCIHRRRRHLDAPRASEAFFVSKRRPRRGVNERKFVGRIFRFFFNHMGANLSLSMCLSLSLLECVNKLLIITGTRRVLLILSVTPCRVRRDERYPQHQKKFLLRQK